MMSRILQWMLNFQLKFFYFDALLFCLLWFVVRFVSIHNEIDRRIMFAYSFFFSFIRTNWLWHILVFFLVRSLIRCDIIETRNGRALIHVQINTCRHSICVYHVTDYYRTNWFLHNFIHCLFTQSASNRSGHMHTSCIQKDFHVFFHSAYWMTSK